MGSKGRLSWGSFCFCCLGVGRFIAARSVSPPRTPRGCSGDTKSDSEFHGPELRHRCVPIIGSRPGNSKLHLLIIFSYRESALIEIESKLKREPTSFRSHDLILAGVGVGT